jgi:Na+/proline symporter
MKPRTRWEFIAGWIVLSALLAWITGYIAFRIVMSIMLAGACMVFLARSTWTDNWFKKPSDKPRGYKKDEKTPRP